MRFVPHFSDPGPFKIDGVYCRLIPLTQGHFAIVDDEDYRHLAAYKWQVLKLDGRFVAARSVSLPKKTIRYMHHDIFRAAGGFMVDHANRVATDNRRKNLRQATPLQNTYNRSVSTQNTSGFKGVSCHSQTGKWRATIRVNGNLVSLGLYLSSRDAAVAYDKAAAAHFGEFAYLNFPPKLNPESSGEEAR